MKKIYAALALVLVSSQAFAADVCGVRAKSIPLVGSVEYAYTRTGSALTIDITKLSGIGAKTMITKGLNEGIDASVEAAEATVVKAFFADNSIKVGTQVSMEVVGEKTVVTINGVSAEFASDLQPGIASYIEAKITSGEGGSHFVQCQ